MIEKSKIKGLQCLRGKIRNYELVIFSADSVSDGLEIVPEHEQA